MKLILATTLLTTALGVSTISTQFPWLNLLSKSLSRPAAQRQEPMMNIPIPVPGSSGRKNDHPSTGTADLSLSDVIGKERIINIFAGFTRDIDSISKRLDDPAKMTTVLAPLNSELQKLPRKPWEDARDYDAMGVEAYEGESGENRATRNLRRFVEAHAVPVSPWKEGEKVNSLRGEKVWWEEKDGTKVVGVLCPYDEPAYID